MRVRRRLVALGAASFSLAQVLGGVWPGRPSPAEEAALLFYAGVWVVSMHELMGTRPRPRKQSSWRRAGG